MNLPHRIDLLVRLGEYILLEDPEWREVKEQASQENGWFIPAFIDIATNNIARNFLQKELLNEWVSAYKIEDNREPLKVGITMAGNIPLAGFHDWLSVFISGHKAMIKPSSRDKALIKHLTAKIANWDDGAGSLIEFPDMLKGCDAYIATGSNNSSGYFEYYFAKYPHIIRRNRTSVAILDGNETREELELLADDVFLYFGLGCRNVTHIKVPPDYDFLPLLAAFKKYDFLAEHHKYRNNIDYNLAILLLNKIVYMSSGALLLVENTGLFSPISQLHYSFYPDKKLAVNELLASPDLQCIGGHGHIPFGSAQSPGLTDYADGVDTLDFLSRLLRSDKNQ